VDELWLTLEPRLFGQGTPFLREAHDLTLSLIDVQTLGASGTLLVRYRAHRP
jgi:dihydrofolate reductase